MAAACGVALLALAACDTFPSRAKIGAVASPGSTLQLTWVNCRGEHVKRVELRLTDKHHSKTLRVLWAVEADVADPMVTRFTAGRTPDGYREVVPLVGGLDGADPVTAVVTSTRVDNEFLDFTVSELRADSVLVNRSPRHVTTPVFIHRARKSCG